ncbi:NAD(P)/FAD-dependent oxidoreductase [Streptomyces sediminimaris]|uniref:NAD(P)/FAD-dependent oxidoreductase n=1 Tax=Streptomyces sediminimaris TaxID=3383721 RepID=UPI00399B067D
MAYDADVLVVGGGPAGLASALHAARAGLTVAVCEQRTGPVDKACGEGIMPAGVERLRALGVRPEGAALTGIDYLDLSGRRAHAPFLRGSGLGLRRTELQEVLAAAAKAAGAQLLHRRITTLEQDAVSVTAGGLRVRWLVAADGLHSPLRRHLGVQAHHGGLRRFGVRRHWYVRPWTSAVEVTWGPHAEAYVTPVAADQVGVAVLYRPERAPAAAAQHTYEALLSGFPALRRRLAEAAAASSVRGAGPMPQRPERRVVGRVLLVGDSAGYEDALTGEGISLALAQAQTAVDALLSGAPHRYERQWHRTTRRYRLLTQGLVRATTRPAPRALLVPACRAVPALFTGVVNQLAR